MAMEAIVAIAVALAFWIWAYTSYFASTHGFIIARAFVSLSTVVIIVDVGITSAGKSPGFRDRVRRSLGILNILVAFWFISIESFWFFEDCFHCRNSRIVTETRIWSVVVHRKVWAWRDPTTIERIAADLGIPCRHNKTKLWQKQRWSGMCLLVEDGGTRISDDWYPPCARETVRSWASDPTFVDTFRRRVMEDFDVQFWRSLIFRLYDACPPDQLPVGALRR